MHGVFNESVYYSRKKFFKLFGGEIRIFKSDRSTLVGFVKQKAFKLKESLTLYGDESMQEPLLNIEARSIIDFGAAYDVKDAKTGERVGVLRRRGLKSILRDSWEILDADEKFIAKVEEDSMLMSLVRRALSNLVPQTFNVIMGGSEVAEFRQTFNPFVAQFTADFSKDAGGQLDRRLGLAALTLLQIIEGRQE